MTAAAALFPSVIEAALPAVIQAESVQEGGGIATRRFRRSFPAHLAVFDGHYPGFPIVPGVLLIEAASVVVEALLGPASRWIGIHTGRFQKPVRPDDEIVIEIIDDPPVVVAAVESGHARVRVALRVSGESACSATLIFAPTTQDTSELGLIETADTEWLGNDTEALDISQVLPHRQPILLVDRIDALFPGRRIRTRKAISANEMFHGRKSTTAAFPWSLTLESWCQSAGLLVSLGRPNPDVLTGDVMLFGGLRGVRFGRSPVPGDVLVHEAQLDRSVDGTAVLSGRTSVDGRVIMTVDTITLTRRPAYTLTGS